MRCRVWQAAEPCSGRLPIGQSRAPVLTRPRWYLASALSISRSRDLHWKSLLWLINAFGAIQDSNATRRKRLLILAQQQLLQ